MSRNILTIMTDQHRIDTLGAYGCDPSVTPNLDRLAAEGSVFRNAFTPSAICTPARGSLLTGQAPFRHRLLANAEWNIGYRTELEEDAATYSRELRRLGYQVGHVGKWHAGAEMTPKDYGFDGINLPGAMNPVRHADYTSYLDKHGLPPARMHDQVRGVLPGDKPGHLLAARLNQPVEATFEHFLADTAIDMLTKYACSDAPFSIDLHFFGPHLPYVIPDEYFDLVDPGSIELPDGFAETFADKPPVQQNYSTYWSCDSFDVDEWKKLIAVYRGYVALIDFEIGRVLQAARDLGVLDETLVIFIADHGEFTGSHRLHDKGPAMYDDIYRIPTLISCPGAPAGQIRDEFVTLMDITATIVDWCGGEVSFAVDGRSVLPLVRGEPETTWRDHLICEFHGHHFHYQQRMLRTSEFKLVVSPESVNELYDLVKDPAELHNRYRAPAYRAVRDRLEAQLCRELSERGDTVFAQWMSAMSDFVGPLGATARTDLDAVAAASSGS